MARRGLVPKPAAFAYGGLSFALRQVYALFAAAALPPLLELWRSSPHLAWTGILVVVASPAWAVTVLHRLAHGVLDVFDPSGSTASPAEASLTRSLWAGFFAWMVLLVSSLLATLVLLAIDPPEAPEPDIAASLVKVASRTFSWRDVFTLHSLVWVVIASFLHQLERSVRGAA